MSAAPALSVSGVSRSFGGLRAVDGVALSVWPGERRALIGPNGAGKTTLFNMIAGELEPSAGRIALFGRDVTRLPPHRRAALGLARTFQMNTLFPTLTVMENLLLAVHGVERTKLELHRPVWSYRHLCDRAREVLDSVGLSGAEETAAEALSHGEQRQLEIALALASRPRILLLDEPTAGLSAAESTRVTELLRRLDPDMSLLVIEHHMEVVFGVTDRITVLHHGKVVAEGSRDEVRADPLVAEIYLGTG
jgi:branched-chain amino acid transport system ATP-binding protein